MRRIIFFAEGSRAEVSVSLLDDPHFPDLVCVEQNALRQISDKRIL